METMILNPRFNYQKHTEILKRFGERLSTLDGVDPPTMGHVNLDAAEAVAIYVHANLKHIRQAMSELLADDIELQIATHKFPIAPQLMEHWFHPFEAIAVDDDGGPNILCMRCSDGPGALTHTL